jgi:hypothetical protein
MPKKDLLHDMVAQALAKDGWQITADPYVISFGERFLFVDLGAMQATSDGIPAQLVGAERDGQRIAVEIKQFPGKSVIKDLEQAIGQYVLYRLLLNKVDSGRELYLGITDIVFDEIFSEPIGELVIEELPLQLLVIDVQEVKVQQWIRPR